MAGESQPAASSANYIRRIWGGTVFPRRRNDSPWLWSSRCRSSGGGGSSGESSAVVREGAVCEAGVVGNSARAETRPGRYGESGPPRGRGEVATRRCLERRQVLNLGIPSGGSIVGPRIQIVPKGSSRRGREQVDHVMVGQSGGAIETN